MRCDRAREAVQEALLGRPASGLELAIALPEEAQRHLEGCAACREAAQELLALDRMLGDALGAIPEMPADLVAGVMLALDRPEAGVTTASRSYVPQVASAAILVVASVGLLVGPVPDVSPATLDLWTAAEALAVDFWASLQVVAIDVTAPVRGLSLDWSLDAGPGSIAAVAAVVASAALAHWGLLGGSARHA